MQLKVGCADKDASKYMVGWLSFIGHVSKPSLLKVGRADKDASKYKFGRLAFIGHVLRPSSFSWMNS